MVDARTAHDLGRPAPRTRGRAAEAGTAMIRTLMARALAAGKLAEIGQLATGIIHEINNPISCLRSNVTLLLEHVPALAELALQKGGTAHARGTRRSAGAGDEESRVLLRELGELSQDIAAAIELLTSITRNLKSLAYSAHDEPKEADLHECIEAALDVARHELRYRVRVERDFGEIPKLVAYPGLLIQMFLNLFVNAAQAIEGEGVLRIRTSRESAEVAVEVSDTGPGIPAEHLEKIFRCFFTTKPAGTGLGLGLSICKRIVDRHGGQITVSSARGKGTMFRIKLPLEVSRSGTRGADERASNLAPGDEWRPRGVKAAPATRTEQLMQRRNACPEHGS